MIHFNGPTTIHTAIDGNAGDVRVTVTPDAAEIARLQARVAELEAQVGELNEGLATILTRLDTHLTATWTTRGRDYYEGLREARRIVGLSIADVRDYARVKEAPNG